MTFDSNGFPYPDFPFPCCTHCGCCSDDRLGHDASCRQDCHLAQGICGCGNRFDGDNFCMIGACQEEQ